MTYHKEVRRAASQSSRPHKCDLVCFSASVRRNGDAGWSDICCNRSGNGSITSEAYTSSPRCSVQTPAPEIVNVSARKDGEIAMQLLGGREGREPSRLHICTACTRHFARRILSGSSRSETRGRQRFKQLLDLNGIAA